MKRHSLLIVCAISALMGCGQRYDVPDVSVVVPAEAGAEIVGPDEILLRTYFNPGSAISELNTAACRVSARGRAIAVTPPVLLSVAVSKGSTRNIDVVCNANVGPRSLESTSAVRPLVPTIEGETVPNDVYPPSLNIRFF